MITYMFPQIDDLYEFDSLIRFYKGEAINLKELFGVGKNRATMIDSIVWRAGDDGIWADIYFRDYM